MISMLCCSDTNKNWMINKIDVFLNRLTIKVSICKPMVCNQWINQSINQIYWIGNQLINRLLDLVTVNLFESTFSLEKRENLWFSNKKLPWIAIELKDIQYSILIQILFNIKINGIRHKSISIFPKTIPLLKFLKKYAFNLFC